MKTLLHLCSLLALAVTGQAANIQGRPTPTKWQGMAAIKSEDARDLCTETARGIWRDRDTIFFSGPLLTNLFSYWAFDVNVANELGISYEAVDAIQTNDLFGANSQLQQSNAGLFNGALQFTSYLFQNTVARGPFISFPTILGFSNWLYGDFTIRFWLQLTDYQFTDASLFRFSRNNTGYQYTMVLAMIQQDAGFHTDLPPGVVRPLLRFSPNPAPTFNPVEGTDLFYSSQTFLYSAVAPSWVQFVIVWEETARRVKFYVNGAKGIDQTLGAGIFSGTYPIQIMFGHAGAENIAGLGDEMGLWTMAWTDAQVSDDYTNPKTFP